MGKERLPKSASSQIDNQRNKTFYPDIEVSLINTKRTRLNKISIAKKREPGDMTKLQTATLVERLERRRRNESPHIILEHREISKSGMTRIKSEVEVHASSDRLNINDTGFVIERVSDTGIWPEKKELATNGGVFEEYVAKQVIPQMSEENRKSLLDYIDQGGRILYSYDLKTSERFKQMFERYKEENHGGADIIAHVMSSAESNLLRKEHADNGNVPKDPEEGKMTMQRLLNEDSVRNAIHFIAISPNEQGEVPMDVRNALGELNKHLLPVGFNSLMRIIEAEKMKGDRNKAIIIAGIGAAIGAGMYTATQLGAREALGWSEERYKFWQQTFVSLSGEVAALEVNMAGSTDGEEGGGSKWKKELAETLIEKNKQEGNGENKKEKKLLDRLPGWLRKRITRYPIIVPGILGVQVPLSKLSTSTGEISWFLAVAPTNRALYTVVEIWNRASGLKKQGVVADGGESHLAAVDYLSSHDGRLHKRLAKMAEKKPALALAIKDFTKNKVGLYSLIGTVVSLPIIKAATMVWPVLAMPADQGGLLEATYTISGIMFENGFGAGGGYLSLRKTPFEQLEERLPVYQKMEEKREARLREKMANMENGEGNNDAIKRRELHPVENVANAN